MIKRRRQALDSQVKKLSTVVFSFFVGGSGSDRCGSGQKNNRFHIPGLEPVFDLQSWL